MTFTFRSAVLLLLLSLLGTTEAFAISAPNTGHVYGKITDGKTQGGLGYVAVSILAADKDSLISGMLTDDNGGFSFSNLPYGNFRLKATYEGYTPLIKKISLTPAASE